MGARSTCQAQSRSSANLIVIALCFLALLLNANRPAQAQTFTVLYNFTGGSDGGSPMAGLYLDQQGNLYGTTTIGGDFINCAPTGCGVVFKLDSQGNYSVLHTFNSFDGSSPFADLTADASGNLYGTAELGGDSQNAGVAYRLDNSGDNTILHAFTAGSDGGEPIAGFLLDGLGNMYGTATIGGKVTACGGVGCGLVFKLDSVGNQTILHNFSFADGAGPAGDLIADQFHAVYGVTSGGGLLGNPSCGAFGCGVVYRIGRGGNETILYRFQGKNDGYYPFGKLLADGSGNLYGTTRNGGPSNDFGTVYRLDQIGHKTIVHAFAGFPNDGRNPRAGLIRDPAGNAYGTTSAGGLLDAGTVYRLNHNGVHILHNFTGSNDGGFPVSSLVRDGHGNLYGTTVQGGLFDYGVIFKISQ